MAVYTDSPEYAAHLFGLEAPTAATPVGHLAGDLNSLVERMFTTPGPVFSIHRARLPWPHVLISEVSEGSQYDRLIRLARDGFRIPHGVVCLAGSGSGFHGFKGRSWAALPGNLHLAVHLAPGRAIDRFEAAFLVLAALSVTDSLDQIAGLTEGCGIKWVNDILLGEAKVAGVLAYTQSQGEKVTSAVLGIGINVETTPELAPTPFVPRVASIRDFASPWATGIRESVFLHLLHALAGNYETLLQDGLSPLLERYRSRSMILGREVTICTERSDQAVEVVAEGRVMAIGSNLELILEGRTPPVRSGRLVFGRISG